MVVWSGAWLCGLLLNVALLLFLFYCKWVNSVGLHIVLMVCCDWLCSLV